MSALRFCDPRDGAEDLQPGQGIETTGGHWDDRRSPIGGYGFPSDLRSSVRPGTARRAFDPDHMVMLDEVLDPTHLIRSSSKSGCRSRPIDGRIVDLEYGYSPETRLKVHIHLSTSLRASTTPLFPRSDYRSTIHVEDPFRVPGLSMIDQARQCRPGGRKRMCGPVGPFLRSRRFAMDQGPA
jgi:hypothetical protein